MSIESADDLIALRRIGQLVARALAAMERAAEPGMTTADLDEVGAAVLRGSGARSAPQLVYGFPGFNLISVNEQIVHGIPGRRRLLPGDVLTLEPLIADRPCRVVEEADGWTLRTHNRALAAHFEETIVVTSGEPLILTAAA